MSPIYVVIKHDYLKYEEPIYALLGRLGYAIIERKQITFSREQAIAFLSTIDEGASPSDFEEFIDDWQSGMS